VTSHSSIEDATSKGVVREINFHYQVRWLYSFVGVSFAAALTIFLVQRQYLVFSMLLVPGLHSLACAYFVSLPHVKLDEVAITIVHPQWGPRTYLLSEILHVDILSEEVRLSMTSSRSPKKIQLKWISRSEGEALANLLRSLPREAHF
jgi:hypothetical protein